ncbi:hypothetical protein CAEBREN_30001 [Caenorhabditis brenneri]|uniref:Uncharacterized protein n=1 Tax=Caenorhabditis brenneri TaxID=135651 RepID=G0MXX6_CAEBE|nr:hypothetical protein CAEBREN_30001 [Caenorhabditis brenneri]
MLLLSIFFFINLSCEFTNNILEQSNATTENIPKEIAIVAVITENTDTKSYEIALKSIQCYARAQKYSFILAKDSEYGCRNNDSFLLLKKSFQTVFMGQIMVLFINTTWNYTQQLIQTEEIVTNALLEYEKKVASDKIEQMGKLFELINRRD